MLNIKKIDGEALFEVTFSATAAEGMSVCIAGSFNDWDPLTNPMKDCGGKLYQTVLKLPAGYYEYKFVIGDDWLLDDTNPNFAANDFGTLNSFFVLE